MDRSELYMVDTYKCEELKKRLKPVEDWSKVKRGTKLFHDTDNNIYNDNAFISYDEDNNLVTYWVQDYSKPENNEYTMSASGWYFYDENIVDDVAEYFTPKLYIVSSNKYPEDYWFIVAFNDKHLIVEFKKSMRKEDISEEEFYNKYQYEVLNKVDGFEITLK